MEFGYNTDVTFEGGEYHVQTEGKFGKKPRVDTLVYKSGSVLQMLSRPNAELSWAAPKRAASQKLIKKQHLRVVSMIRKGQFDRLEQEAAQAKEPAKPQEETPEAPPKPAPQPPPKAAPEPPPKAAPKPPPKPAPQPPPKAAPEPPPEAAPKASAQPRIPEPPREAADATVVLQRPFIPKPPAPSPSTDEFLEAAEPASPPALFRDDDAAASPDDERTVTLSAEEAIALASSPPGEPPIAVDAERPSNPPPVEAAGGAESFFEDEDQTGAFFEEEEEDAPTILRDGADLPLPSQGAVKQEAAPPTWNLSPKAEELLDEEEPTIVTMVDRPIVIPDPDEATLDDEMPTVLAADANSLAAGDAALASAAPAFSETDIEDATIIAEEATLLEASSGAVAEAPAAVAGIAVEPSTMELPAAFDSPEQSEPPTATPTAATTATPTATPSAATSAAPTATPTPTPTPTPTAAPPPDEDRTLIADTAELPSLEEVLTPADEPVQAPPKPAVQRPEPERKNGRMLVFGILGIGVIIIGLLALVVAFKLLTMKRSGSEAGPRHGGTSTATAPPVETRATQPGTKTTPTAASTTPGETPIAAPAADIDETIAKANAAAASGRAEEAIGILSAAIQSSGADAKLLIARGRLLKDMGRPREALLDFRAAAGKEPGNPTAFYVAGQAAIDLGSMSDLRSSIEGLRRMGATFELALLEGQASFIAGKTDEAAALLRKAISERPDDYRGYLAMGNVLLGLGEKNALPTFLLNAKENFDKAASRAPGNPQVSIAMARQRMAAKAEREAIPILQKTISQDASSFDSHLLLGICYLRQKRPGQALPPLERASNLAPSNSEAALLAGTAANKISRHDVAVDYFLNALLNQKKPDYIPYPGIHKSRRSLKALISSSIKGALKRNPDDKKALKLLDITVNLR